MTISKTQKWIGAALGVAGLATAVLLTVSPAQFHTSHYKRVGNGSGDIYKPSGDTSYHRGDTLAIVPGTYTTITFGDIHGALGDSLVIINDGGIVRTTGYIKFFRNCTYFKITGSGSPDIRYWGFNACIVAERNSHYRINRTEPTDGNVGIFMAQKSDPADPITYYDNYRSVGVIIDDNNLHRLHGEAMYIGRSTLGKDDGDPLHYPIWMDSVQIFNNTIDSADWDGIQTSNTRYTKIFNNRVTHYGLINKDSQKAGIIGGGNTDCEIYNNTVINGTGNGVQGFGYNVSIHNNFLDSCGRSQGEQSIITSDLISEADPQPLKQNERIFSNTIKHPNILPDAYGGVTNVIKCFYEHNNADSCVVNNNSIFDVPSNYNAIVVNVPKQRISGNILNGQATDIPPTFQTSITATLITRSISLNYKNTFPNSKTQLEYSTDNITWQLMKVGIVSQGYVLAIPNGTAIYSTPINPIYVRTKITKSDGVVVNSASFKM